MSRDIPIILSAPMILALLSGRKTMTRRLAWKGPFSIYDDEDGHEAQKARKKGCKVSGPDDLGTRIAWPPSPWQKIKIDDRLWVRENFARNANQLSDTHMDTSLVYAADNNGRALDNGDEKPWTPCIHMPRVASRLTLVVTGTKIERLTAISEIDAIAEGIRELNRRAFISDGPLYGTDEGEGHDTAVGAFNHLWRSLHGDNSWAENPEVVALTFRVINANIDSPKARAA